MSRKIFNILLFSVFFQIGCLPFDGHSTDDDSGPFESASAAELRDLESSYLKYKLPPDNSDSLPPELQPATVLHRLNGWFRVGKGLMPAKDIGQTFEVYKLKRIPDQVFDGLEKNMIDFSVHRTSFFVLTKQFWRQIRYLQEQGFQLGLMQSFGQRPAAGLFIPRSRMIVFHVLAEPGLLVHEYQHSRQYDFVSKFSNIPFEVLKSRCINDVSAALAEVQAMQVEYLRYQGVASEIEPHPGWSHPIPNDFKDEVQYPQIDLFYIGMAYPGKALAWVKSESECPKELFEAIQVMWQIADQEYGHLTNLLSALKVFREMDLDLHRQLTCAMQVDCPRDRRIESVEAKADQIKASFDQELDQSNERRRLGNASALEALSVSVKRDLCRHAQGAAFLMRCPKLEENGQ